MHCTKISAKFKFGGHSPLVRTPPPKCGVRLRRWENQRTLSSLQWLHFCHCQLSCWIIGNYLFTTHKDWSAGKFSVGIV